MFTMGITTDGEAFTPDATLELARILRGIANRIEHHGLPFNTALSVLDTNGNTVGRALLTSTETI